MLMMIMAPAFRDWQTLTICAFWNNQRQRPTWGVTYDDGAKDDNKANFVINQGTRFDGFLAFQECRLHNTRLFRFMDLDHDPDFGDTKDEGVDSQSQR